MTSIAHTDTVSSVISQAGGNCAPVLADENVSVTITAFGGATATKGRASSHDWLTLCEAMANVVNTPHTDKKSQKLAKLAKFTNESRADGAPVIECYGLELDYDAGGMTLEDAADQFRAARIAAFGYETYSSTDDAPKWRLIVPFSAPVQEAERIQYSQALARLTGIDFASESHRPKQCFFFGRHPDKDPQIITVEGCCVDTLPSVRAAVSKLEAEDREAVERDAFDKAEREARKRVSQAGGNSSLISRFNEDYAPAEILEQHGYTCDPVTGKYCHPDSKGGIAGVSILKDPTGVERCYSHHSKADPLADGKAHDAFDCFSILDHGGDERAALHDIGERFYPEVTQANREAYKAARDGGTDRRVSKQPNHLAAKIAPELRPRFRFDESDSTWYGKVGDIWKPQRDGDIARAVYTPLDELIPSGFRSALQKDVTAFLGMWLHVSKWEESRHLLPLCNGVLNLETKELEPYGERMFTWQLPYNFDSEATCPTIKRYLITATGGDREIIRFLLAWMWAVIHGRADLQKYIELIGHGGTGKSTFLDLLTELVGRENTVTTDLKQLETNRFESANLKGKRLALITDSQRYGGEVSQLKAITGGDQLRNEKKHTDAGEPFRFKGLVAIAANEPIQSSDYTSGLARRRVPVRFDYKVSDKEKDRYRGAGGIISAMRGQLPGLLNWLIAISEADAIDLIRNPGKELRRQQAQASVATNPVLHWLDECCITCSGDTSDEEDPIGTADDLSGEHLYANYIKFCESTGHKHPLTLTRFGGLLLDNCLTYGLDTQKQRKRLRTRNDKQATVILRLRLRRGHDDGKPGMITGEVVSHAGAGAIPEAPGEDIKF